MLKPGQLMRKGVLYNSDGAIAGCVFCRITNKDPTEPATIISETPKFVAFKTIAPISSLHFLISPKSHIQNVDSLKTADDIVLVQEMVDFAKKVLEEEAENAIFCFHMPPFNSIDHLHLHAIARCDEIGWLSWLKYYQGSKWCQSADDVIARIQKDLDSKINS